MEMKKVACAAVVFAAASMSAALAQDAAAAPAPAPTSGAAGVLPALGSLVGASVVSFVAFYLQ
ncbi:unnamed protein product [Linum tenue]|uniref:Arabinogalactan peptide 23-like n=1 Tax=Linum tenue TaxID=586396 RepID=A0AAV0RCJ5_9ROSI|nr:unnamed protein product [Linum tenue]